MYLCLLSLSVPNPSESEKQYALRPNFESEDEARNRKTNGEW